MYYRFSATRCYSESQGALLSFGYLTIYWNSLYMTVLWSTHYFTFKSTCKLFCLKKLCFNIYYFKTSSILEKKQNNAECLAVTHLDYVCWSQSHYRLTWCRKCMEDLLAWATPAFTVYAWMIWTPPTPVTASMVTPESSAKPTGTNAGHHHARMVVFVLMELLCLIALVQLDMLVNINK